MGKLTTTQPDGTQLLVTTQNAGDQSFAVEPDAPPTPGGGVCLIASFGVPHDGDIAQGQFLGPFSTEPHALETRVQAMHPANEVDFMVATADTNGGVTGDTTLTLRENGSPVGFVTIATGQNTNLVTTLFALTPGSKLSVELTTAPDAGTSAYSLAVYGKIP